MRYRETIKGRGESSDRHKSETGGVGLFARSVDAASKPMARDDVREFTQSLVGQNADRASLKAVAGRKASIKRVVRALLPVIAWVM